MASRTMTSPVFNVKLCGIAFCHASCERALSFSSSSIPSRICPKGPSFRFCSRTNACPFILKKAYACKLLLTSAAKSLPVKHMSDYWRHKHLSPMQSAGFLVGLGANSSLATHASEPRVSLVELTTLAPMLVTHAGIGEVGDAASSPRTGEVVLRSGITSVSLSAVCWVLRIGRAFGGHACVSYISAAQSQAC